MAHEFVDVVVLDNFYQTSSFYPMPVVLVSTVAETGQTNLGPYSLCFPYVVTGEHAMMLISRTDSNTAENIRRNHYVALNFIPDTKKYLKCCVALGFPGESTAEKMEHSCFTLIPSQRKNQQPDVVYPEIVAESVQVFECSWDPSYIFEPNQQEAHFLLRIDNIAMQKKWYDCLQAGKGFPRLPIDYGYRDNTHFWFTRHSRPFSEPIPKGRGLAVDAIQYAADRMDPTIKWEREACAMLIDVPRIFLKRVLTAIVDQAQSQGIQVITPEVLNELRSKRR